MDTLRAECYPSEAESQSLTSDGDMASPIASAGATNGLARSEPDSSSASSASDDGDQQSDSESEAGQL